MLEVKGRASMLWYWAAMGVALSALGWWLLDWVEDWGKLMETLAVSLMLSGVVIVGFGIFKALDRRPVLVVDGDGVLDRTSFPVRRIPWADIRGFQLAPARERAPLFLAIELADPEAFIAKGLLSLTRPMLESFQNSYGSPCVISLRALDAEPNTLLVRLRDALNRRNR